MYGGGTEQGGRGHGGSEREQLLLSPQPRQYSQPTLFNSTQSLSSSTNNQRRNSMSAISGSSNKRDKRESKPILSTIYDTTSTDLNAENELEDRRQQRNSFLYTLLNARSRSRPASIYKWFISTVILVDLIIFIISTEPDIEEHQRHFFVVSEGVTSTIFLIEYLARLLTITESRKYGDYGQILGRLHYAVSWPALIDFFATVPFFMEQATGWDLPTLTYLRCFRLLRILKTNGMVKATDAVWRVIYYNREILYVALFVCIFMVMVTSLLMYYLRPQDPEDAEDFKSIAATMYLSTLLLTGQGGPSGDLPWYTKGVVLLTGAFSIAMFAIPASMLTWGFEAEAERCAKRARKRKLAAASDDMSYASEDYSTDEEYQRIIAGEDSVGGSDDGDFIDPRSELLEQFTMADRDGTGTLNLREFFEVLQNPSIRDQLLLAKGKEDDGDGKSFNLASRLSELETKVDKMDKKLDRICGLLEKKWFL